MAYKYPLCDVDDITFELINLQPFSQRDLFTAVRVQRDTAIVAGIFSCLANNIDDYLTVLNNGIQAYELRSLEESSIEYSNIKSSFQSTLNPLRDSYKVKRIDKVLCPYLFSAFLLMQKKKEIVKLPKKVALYHGTYMTNISSICKTNFNWRLQGTSKGHIFGQGISFAQRSTYACHYPPASFNSIKTLILAQVLLTKHTVGSASTKVPPEGYDATAKGNLDVIVKYDDAEYFPEYIIYY